MTTLNKLKKEVNFVNAIYNIIQLMIITRYKIHLSLLFIVISTLSQAQNTVQNWKIK
jgi:ribosomal protein S25